MTFGGWIFMVVSWSVILGMFSYCMYRTFRNKSDASRQQQPESAADNSA